MSDLWIGEKVNASGSYTRKSCEGLMSRIKCSNTSDLLYSYKTKYNDTVYISDQNIINEIDEISNSDDVEKYLDKAYINLIGLDEFINKVKAQKEAAYTNGLKRGRAEKLHEIKLALGLNTGMRW